MTRFFVLPHPLEPPHKNIVICLDGTGNRFEACNSNVVKLFQVCVRDRNQIAYYDPGVGTLGDAGYKTSLGRRVNMALGGAIGVGLMKNVEEAYSYLMEHYVEGDRIFIFGFSRGAFTARVLAGFINRCGLFEKGCQNLIPYAMESFIEQQKSDASDEETQDYFKLRSSFRRTFGRRFKVKGRDDQPSLQTPIHFLGLWDSVKSYGRLYNPSRIPRESTNESVGIVRHAIALDEKRVFFPQMHWRRKGKGQDVREVWFAGAHGDVGGTPREIETGLSKIALDWMLCHAVEAGLQIDHDDYLHIVHGLPARAGADAQAIAKPDPAALRHESLSGPWWVIEALPWRRNDGPSDGPLYWRPRRAQERMRAVPGSAVIHGSAIERISHSKERYQGSALDAPYRPGQLPSLAGHPQVRLANGLPVLIAGPDPKTQRLLLPLPDGSGEVLLHVLSEAERKAWPLAGCDDGLTALGVLALATGQAMREVFPISVLTRMVWDAIKKVRTTQRFAENTLAAGWLDAFTVPAEAAAGSWGALTKAELAKHELALREACAPLDDRLDDARSVVRSIARWMDEFERAWAAQPRAADPGATDLGAWLRVACTVSVESHSDALAKIDALLDAFERVLQASIALLVPIGKSDRAVAALAAVGPDHDAQAKVDDLLDAALLAAFERALEAWIALRLPAGIAPAPGRRMLVSPMLARFAILGAVGASDATKMATKFRAQLRNVQNLRQCDGRHLAVAQALDPDEAVQALARAFEAVVKLVDWPGQLAEHADLLRRGAQDAAAPATPLPTPHRNIRSQHEWGEARGLAIAQALKADRAVAPLPAVKSDRDAQAAIDAAPGVTFAPKQPGPVPPAPAQQAAHDAKSVSRSTLTEQLDKVIGDLDTFDTLVSRMGLSPEQHKDLSDARGHVHESLVTWADRLRWAERQSAVAAPAVKSAFVSSAAHSE